MCFPGEHQTATKLFPYLLCACPYTKNIGRVEINCKALIQYGNCTTDKANCVISAEMGHINRIYCYSVIAKQVLQIMHLFGLNILEMFDCARIRLD